MTKKYVLGAGVMARLRLFIRRTARTAAVKAIKSESSRFQPFNKNVAHARALEKPMNGTTATVAME